MRFFLGLAACILLNSAAHALFMGVETKEIHISRFVSNLEQRSEANPKDATLHYQIGRFYAMAYATSSESLDVRAKEASVFDNNANLETVPAYYLYSIVVDYDLNDDMELPPNYSDADPRHREPRTEMSDDAKKRHLDRYIQDRTIGIPFLDKAIDRYKKALRLEPDNLVFQLGYAWALDQSGDAEAAIPLYEAILKTLIEKDSKNPNRSFTHFAEQMAAETREYLITLVKPEDRRYAEIKGLCDLVEKEIPRPGYAITPLVLPLNSNLNLGDLLSTTNFISFNLDGLGRGGKWSWITPDAGWLVWDPERTGRIESGRQLFGNVTFWVFWENGYDALAALDDDLNGSIEGGELIGLAIWRDANSNGISEPGEVLPISDWGITAFACTHEKHETGIAWNPRGVTLAGGEIRPTYDVLLDYKK